MIVVIHEFFDLFKKKVGGSRWSFDKIIFDLDFFYAVSNDWQQIRLQIRSNTITFNFSLWLSGF